jgi:hypothetical protein
MMRVALGAMAFAIAIGLAGPSSALTPPTNATAVKVAPPVDATIVAEKKKCRCVEKRWNGSCKKQVCGDKQ